MHYMKVTRQGLETASKSGQLQEDAMQEAQAAVEIMQAIEQAIPPEFLQIVAKAHEQAQQFQPPQPQDPTMIAADVQKQSIAQRAQSDQMRLQAQQQRDQTQAQTQLQRDQINSQDKQQQQIADERKQQQADQVAILLETLRQDREDQRKQADIDARLSMNREDNETAKELTAVEVASGERTSLTTGTGINPNP